MKVRAGLLAVLGALLTLQASADPMIIVGTTKVAFVWKPTEGAIAYMAEVQYIDGTTDPAQVCTGDPTNFENPPCVFRPRQGTPFRLVVRGCASETDCSGEWSEPSNLFVLCPAMVDSDCDLAVGVQDFVILSERWGEKFD